MLAYCWRCETPLSNTETRMDDVYRDRQDPALTVGFELLDGPWAGARMLAWTTTPWTLPANLALAVGPDIDYAVVEHDGRRYVLAAERLGAYAAELGEADTVATVRGADLVGAPLPAAVRLLHRPERSGTAQAFQVLAADFVSTEDGTGIVHLAPGFGEDDQVACNAVGIPTLVPMDEHGRYTAEIAPWAGEHVFDANPHVIRHLKDAGVVLRHETYDHCLPALLALRPAARLPGDLLVVRRGHQVPRPDGRAQRADHLGARAPQARQLRQVAGERPRLVDQPQPLLGLADPGVAQRRPRVPRVDVYGSLSELRGRTSGSRSPISTGRRSTSSCGPTPTTRPGGR